MHTREKRGGESEGICWWLGFCGCSKGVLKGRGTGKGRGYAYLYVCTYVCMYISGKVCRYVSMFTLIRIRLLFRTFSIRPETVRGARIDVGFTEGFKVIMWLLYGLVFAGGRERGRSSSCAWVYSGRTRRPVVSGPSIFSLG